MRRVVLGAAALCFFAGASPASAQLAIDRLWVDFEPGASERADLVVRNQSADRYYITVAPSEITNPGTPDEKRVQIVDPSELGLLVTPNRLVIDPGGSRSIRLVSLNNDLTKDRVYRIKITPQIGDLETPDPAAQDRGLSIKLLAAYDVLVTVRPKGAKPELIATRKPTEIVIRNQGNSNALLFDGSACKGDAKINPDAKPGAETPGCEKVASKRVYAGTEVSFPLNAPDAKLRFKERILSSSPPKEVSF